MNAVARHIRPDDPTNVEAEQHFLGAVMHSNEVLAEVAGFLEARHFSEPAHAELYRIMGEMIQAGRPVTPVTIADYLPDMEIGDRHIRRYVIDMFGETLGPMAAAGFARSIHENAIRRDLISIGNGITSWARTARPGDSPAVQVADAEARLFALSAEAARGERGAEDDTIDALMEDIEARAAKGGGSAGARCGIRSIDNRLGGFLPGQMILVGGRPGMGKSAFGLSLARSAARAGMGVGFDSIEMTKPEVRVRLLADETEALGYPVPYERITSAQFRDGELSAVRAAADVIRDIPLHIITAGNRLSDIPGHIRAARKAVHKRGVDLGLFVVDYLGLLRGGDRYAGDRVNELGEISRTLKEIARREAVPIIALHQLNRGVESQARDDRRPGLADLRGSGDLEQDADVVLFVYREHYYLSQPGARVPKAEDGDPRSDQERRADLAEACQNKMELIIAKRRQGRTGVIHLWTNMATNAVRDDR